jgi:ribonuclease VapC
MKTVVIDASAALAVIFREAHADWVNDQFLLHDRLLMSTVNLGEVLIRARSKNPSQRLVISEALVSSGLEYVAPNEEDTIVAADARFDFPINFGDCFCYALAKREDAPILTLDEDFRRTEAALLMPPAA